MCASDPRSRRLKDRPMQTIVIFSGQRRDTIAQRPWQFASHLAQQYNVVYVEEPQCCAGQARLELRPVQDNLSAVIPHLPGYPSERDPGVPRVLAALLGHHLAAHGIDEYITWFSTPSWVGTLAALTPWATVYDCCDDHQSRRCLDSQSRHRESLLLHQADLVIASGPSLCESMRRRHDSVICVPTGVDPDRRSRPSPQPGCRIKSPMRLTCTATSAIRGWSSTAKSTSVSMSTCSRRWPTRIPVGRSSCAGQSRKALPVACLSHRTSTWSICRHRKPLHLSSPSGRWGSFRMRSTNQPACSIPARPSSTWPSVAPWSARRSTMPEDSMAARWRSPTTPQASLRPATHAPSVATRSSTVGPQPTPKSCVAPPGTQRRRDWMRGCKSCRTPDWQQHT